MVVREFNKDKVNHVDLMEDPVVLSTGLIDDSSSIIDHSSDGNKSLGSVHSQVAK